MTQKSNRVLFSLLGVSALFAALALGAIRYADGFSGVIIGIIATVLTPAMGAMVTLLVVTPLRAIHSDTAQIKTISEVNGGKIDGVHDLVDDRMNALVAEMAELRKANDALKASIALVLPATTLAGGKDS